MSNFDDFCVSFTSYPKRQTNQALRNPLSTRCHPVVRQPIRAKETVCRIARGNSQLLRGHPDRIPRAAKGGGITEVPVIEVTNGGLVKKSDRKSVDPF